ncbi:MFS transporter [Streptomyces sp. 4N509B]|uniref:MFS transporter n=1 Tax=Streptomyces sp. 4N509B TaxID=3457413 RepID=UPI003FCF4721
MAVSLVFALHGAVTGNFATRIPWIDDHLDLSTAQLGLALAFAPVGAALAMPLASRVVHRYGPRAAVRGLLALWCASLALPAIAPSLVLLCAAMAVQGALAGMSDVAMNAQGVEVERRLGRSIMSSLHGMWSVGALTGSAVGVLAVHAELDARVHLPLAALALVALTPPACRSLLDVRARPDEEPPPRFTLPPRSALLIGAVGMCAVLAEWASADWSGVYLREMTGASATVAAVSTTAFNATMAATRLTGDLVARRLGAVRTVRTGGALALAGGLLVVTATTPALGTAGFALLGVGVAVVVPLAFAAAGRVGDNPNQAIAGVATVTYTTGLLAPPLIGGLGELASLRASFAVVTVAMAVMILAAGVLRERGGDSRVVAAGGSGQESARPTHAEATDS